MRGIGIPISQRKIERIATRRRMTVVGPKIAGLTGPTGEECKSSGSRMGPLSLYRLTPMLTSPGVMPDRAILYAPASSSKSTILAMPDPASP